MLKTEQAYGTLSDFSSDSGVGLLDDLLVYDIQDVDNLPSSVTEISRVWSQCQSLPSWVAAALSFSNCADTQELRQELRSSSDDMHVCLFSGTHEERFAQVAERVVTTVNHSRILQRSDAQVGEAMPKLTLWASIMALGTGRSIMRDALCSALPIKELSESDSGGSAIADLLVVSPIRGFYSAVNPENDDNDESLPMDTDEDSAEAIAREAEERAKEDRRGRRAWVRELGSDWARDAGYEYDSESSEEESIDDDKPAIHIMTGVERSLHLFDSSPFTDSDPLIPLVCGASTHNLPTLMWHCLCHRREWGITAPVIGLQLESASVVGHLTVGWLNTENVLCIARPTDGLRLDLTDVASMLSFVWFLIQLSFTWDSFVSIHAPHIRRAIGRVTEARQNLVELTTDSDTATYRYEQADAWVNSLDKISTSPYGSQLEDSTAMSRKSSSQQAEMLGAQTDKKTKISGDSKSKITRDSNSHFCALADKPDTPCALTFIDNRDGIVVIREDGVPDIQWYYDVYNEVVGFQAPAWTKEEFENLKSGMLKTAASSVEKRTDGNTLLDWLKRLRHHDLDELAQELCEAIELGRQPDAENQMSDDLTRYMARDVGLILQAVLDIKKVDQRQNEDGLLIYEAEYRITWDWLLMHFCRSDDVEHGSQPDDRYSVSPLLERMIHFPSHWSDCVVSTAERAAKKEERRRRALYWFDLYFRDTERPKVLDDIATSIRNFALQLRDRIKAESLEEVQEMAAKEPCQGKCDTVCAVPVPVVVKSEHLRQFSFIQIAEETFKGPVATRATRAVNDKDWDPLRAYECITSPSEALSPLSASAPAIASAPAMFHLHLPFFICEYKKRVTSFVRTGYNQDRIYLLSAVHFFKELGIEDFPVFGLVTEGCLGIVSSAWYSSKKKYVYIMDQNPILFDLRKALGAFHFASFLRRMAVRQATELKGKEDNILKMLKDRLSEGKAPNFWHMPLPERKTQMKGNTSTNPDTRNIRKSPLASASGA